MKTVFALSALAASSLASAYTLTVADSEYRQLSGRAIVASNGGFSVSNSGSPADFSGGDSTLQYSGQQVYVGPTGQIGYGSAPRGSATTGWSTDGSTLTWTRGAVFACPNVSFNIGTPSEYNLFANWESTPNGQADDCFSIHLSIQN